MRAVARDGEPVVGATRDDDPTPGVERDILPEGVLHVREFGLQLAVAGERGIGIAVRHVPRECEEGSGGVLVAVSRGDNPALTVNGDRARLVAAPASDRRQRQAVARERRVRGSVNPEPSDGENLIVLWIGGIVGVRPRRYGPASRPRLTAR